MKKLLAYVLLCCLLLTLTGCGRESEQLYYFCMEETGSHIYVTVQDNVYTLAFFLEEEGYHGSYIREEDGSYMLDMFVIPMRLTHFFGDFYVLTVDEQTDAAFAWLSDRSIVRLHDESSFTIYVRDYIRYTITRDGGKTVAMVTMTDYWSEEWAEGTTVLEFDVYPCTWQLRQRGSTQLLDLTLNDVLSTGVIAGNILTIEVGGVYLELEKVSDREYFGMSNGLEYHLRLHDDGTAEILEESWSGKGSIDFEPGKWLEKDTSDGYLSIHTDGETATVVLNDTTVTLSIVK